MAITITPLQEDELDLAAEIVLTSYDQFVLADMAGPQSRHAIERLVSNHSLSQMLEAGQVMLLARFQDEPAGVIVFRANHRHLLLLFVLGTFHGKGIARQLWEQGKALCLQNHPDGEAFTVNSTPFALGAYQRLGFCATGPEVTAETDGIVYTPMKLEL